MNLSEVRELFIEVSGRSDLAAVDTVLSPDTLIREASKRLDRKLFGGQSEGRYTIDYLAGQILVPIPYCRAVKKVWLYTAEGKVKLSKADSSDEIKSYYSKNKDSKTRETPAVFFPINARHVPASAVPADFSQPYAFDDVLYDSPTSPTSPTDYVIVTSSCALKIAWSGKFIIVNNDTDDVVLTVPAASDITGISINYHIIKTGTGRVTIQCATGDYINDSSAGGTCYCEEASRAEFRIVFVGNSLWVGSGSNIWITT